jgi:hypothetical protein
VKTAALCLLAALMAAPFALGQKVELKLDTIAAKASAKSEVDLDGALLQLALGKVQAAAKEKAEKKEKDGKEGRKSVPANLPALLAGVKGVYVRNYEFEKPGLYADQDLDPIRQQVGSGSGWSRIVNVKEKNESTEIYVVIHGDEIGGCLILSAQPKELTVVHVTGALNLAQMKELVDSNIQYDLSALMSQAAK